MISIEVNLILPFIIHADVNECLLPDLNNCTGSEVCDNIVGSFRCSCVEGYKKSDGGSCKGTGREEGREGGRREGGREGVLHTLC